nr:dihydrofolate reductase family protein [Salsipaludibacter albus]
MWPDPGVEADDEVHADLSRRDDWVASNFVVSLDGAIALAGRSGGLGGDGDLQLFRTLRDRADVVMAGAGTVRTEGYRPTRLRAAEARRARGQEPRPRLVVVTRSADLADVDRLWSEPGAPITVLTGTDAPADRLAWLRERAEVLAVGDDGPDLAAGLDLLRDRGLTRILAEGGPSLQVDLLSAGLVTDLFTTVAPLVVGGGATTVPDQLPETVALSLRSVRRHGDELFLHHWVTPAT